MRCNERERPTKSDALYKYLVCRPTDGRGGIFIYICLKNGVSIWFVVVCSVVIVVEVAEGWEEWVSMEVKNGMRTMPRNEIDAGLLDCETRRTCFHDSALNDLLHPALDCCVSSCALEEHKSQSQANSKSLSIKNLHN
jgi:hypothetical protein